MSNGSCYLEFFTGKFPELFATEHTDVHEFVKKSVPIYETLAPSLWDSAGVRGRDVELLHYEQGHNLG